jgi:hypothetical protein
MNSGGFLFPMTIAVWSFFHFATVFLAVYNSKDKRHSRGYVVYGNILMLEYLVVAIWAALHINF